MFDLRFKKELLHLIDCVETETNQLHLSNSLYFTDSLAWCFAQAIFNAIKGALGALEMGGPAVVKMAQRSLFEYTVDFAYVTVHDSRDINKRFAEYHNLLMYWWRDHFSYHREDISDKYRKYVSEEFSDECPNGTGLISFQKVEEYVERNYKISFTGLNVPKRIEEIAVMALVDDRQCPKLREGPIHERRRLASSRWNEACRKLKESHPTWDDLPQSKKFEHLVCYLAMGTQGIGIWESISFFLRHAKDTQKFYSARTHPTTYVIAPGLVPIDGGLDIHAEPTLEDTRHLEEYLYFTLELTTALLVHCLKNDGERVFQRYQEERENCPGIAQWLSETSVSS
jgi:hypothetical protein